MIFPEHCYPGWKESDLLTGQVVSCSGRIYDLGGTTKAVSIFRDDEARYHVTATHMTSD